MADPFVGEIRSFGFTFAPRNWAYCNGTLVSIASNTLLFSVIGTTYGGDGNTTFALPDLRGRAAIHRGRGPGLSLYNMGQAGGSQTVALTTDAMPSHNHNMLATNDHNQNTPDNHLLGQRPIYNAGDPSTTLHPAAIGHTGSGTSHDNQQPYQVLNFCIAMTGAFPQRG